MLSMCGTIAATANSATVTRNGCLAINFKNLSTYLTHMNSENCSIAPLKNGVFEKQIEYFSVSTTRLVLLSVITFGLYEVYWFYRNWDAVNRAQQKNISPIVRAIFSIFFCYSLFKKIRQSSQENGYGKRIWYSGLLAVFYIILTIVLNASSQLGIGSFNVEMFLLLLGVMACIPLVCMQELINFNNTKIMENYTVVKRYTVIEAIIIVIGAIVFLFNVLYWVDLFFEASPPY